MNDIYDCIIVGAGPAGLAAAIYTSRDRYRTLIVEKYMPGGQINTTNRIENYPGIVQIDGPALVQNMQTQAENFGTEIKTGCEVESLEKQKNGNIAIVCNGEKLITKVVILTPGSAYRQLGIPGEDKFRGSGVSYCGTCDAPFFKGKHVVTVGGGNTAVEETLHVAKFAQKLTMIHRRDEFRASKVLVEELLAKANEPNSNLQIRYNTIITAIEGQKKVESVKLHNVKNNTQEIFPCDGVFVFVGMVPNTGFLKGFVELTKEGFIICDFGYLRTSVPGVFTAGDCRIGAAMQLATAVGDGVVAAMMMKQYLRDPAWWNIPAGNSVQAGGW
jgi:thioredoxin reductase (NADPH)